MRSHIARRAALGSVAVVSRRAPSVGARTVAVRSSVLALAASLSMLTGAGAVAHGATVSFAGDVLTYDAAPGEENLLELRRGAVASDCASRPAPCLVIDERNYWYVSITSFPAERCSKTPDTGVECDVPSSVIVNAGDANDNIGDWDGPSQINGGSGDDVLTGRGGEDTLHGDSGSDSLYGYDGNDTLNGGDGDDYLEGYATAVAGGDTLTTSGSDTYVGGSGRDLVDYGGRDDSLSISLDGARNDGAPGEADSVGADVERVRGGTANDTLTGSAAPNQLIGESGDDTLRGAGGEDYLYADGGNDVLFGEDGQDVLQGANGDDQLNGGPGVDSFNGDGDWHCEACGLGADRIDARDGLSELVTCGGGEDTAILDHNDRIYIQQHCEQVQRGPVTGDQPNPGGGPVTGDQPNPGGAGVGGVRPPAIDPYAKCNKLKGANKTACVKHVKALKKCSKLKGNKKKACIRKASALKRCNQLKGQRKKACVRKVNTPRRRA